MGLMDNPVSTYMQFKHQRVRMHSNETKWKKNCSFPSICIIQAVIHFHHQNIYIKLFIHYQLKGRTLQKMGQFVIVFHYAPIL